MRNFLSKDVPASPNGLTSRIVCNPGMPAIAFHVLLRQDDYVDLASPHLFRVEVWHCLAVVEVQLKKPNSLWFTTSFLTAALKTSLYAGRAETPCRMFVSSFADYVENALRVFDTYCVLVPNVAAFSSSICEAHCS